MYYYVFDPPNGPKEYERIAQIKAYLVQIGIGGESVQVQPGRTVEDLVATALLKRYSTLVAVGGITLITKMAACLNGRDAVFGIIPLFSHPDIAELIGSSEWKSAADALPRRRLQQRRVAYLNDTVPFLTPARITLGNARLEVFTRKCSFYLKNGTVTLQPETELVIFTHDLPTQQRSWLQRFSKISQSIDRTYMLIEDCQITSDIPSSVNVAGTDVVALPTTVKAGEGVLRLIIGPGA